MNVKKAFLFSAALLGCPLFAGPAPQQAQQALSNVDRRFFIENKGQWPEEVLYLTRMGGLDVWITRDGAVYDFYRIEETSDRSETGAADAPIDDMARFSDARRYGHVVRLRLKGARTEDITAAGQDPQPGYYNYFIGNDPSKWASFVGLYRAAVVRDVYAGIDVRYYYDGTGVRYDFIVRPGADVAAIRLALEGAEGVRITDRGELAFTTRFGEVRHAGLRAYQTADDGREVDVACRFTSAGDGTYGFEATAYDPARPLIIDPLIYSTFIGGSGNDRVNAIAVDGSGHAYVTGYTYSSNFPTTSGAYDQTHNGGSDVFVVKLNSNGSSLIYSTFIGGSSYDYGYGLAVDGSGHAYVTGYTYSSNFPTTSGAYDQTHNGSDDVFVVKLNSSGSGLMYATFLGGSNDDRGYGLAVDGSGHAYVAGGVYSTNFPTTSGAYDQTYNGGLYDAFVTKLDLGPLPVEVADFTARVAGHAVVLEWLTASEANSRYFEVQRSPDGRRWTAIGQVPAAGESRQLRRYRMEDNRPLRGTNYYRLKAVDYDGTFDYSGVRKVVFVSEVAGPVILSENPTDGVLRVDASALAGQPLDVRILDAAGREVYRHRYTDSRRVRLTIDGPAGVYTVRLQWRDGQRTYRLMKK